MPFHVVAQRKFHGQVVDPFPGTHQVGHEFAFRRVVADQVVEDHARDQRGFRPRLEIGVDQSHRLIEPYPERIFRFLRQARRCDEDGGGCAEKDGFITGHWNSPSKFLLYDQLDEKL